MSPSEQSALTLSELTGERALGREEATTSAPIRHRGWLVRRALLVGDVLGLAIAFLAAEFLFGPSGGSDRIDVQTEYLFFLLTLPLWVFVAKIYGLYDRDEKIADHSTGDEIVSVIHLVTVGSWLIFAGAWLSGVADPNLAKVFMFGASAIVLVPSFRGLARAFCRRQPLYLQNTIIVGAGEVGQGIATKLLRHPEYGINLVGFVDANPIVRQDELGHLSLLGEPDDLPELVQLLDVERVIVAFSNESHEDMIDMVRTLSKHRVRVDIVPRLFELVGMSAEIHSVEGIPLVGLPNLQLSRSSQLIKHGMDVLVSVLVLLALSPLIALIALALKLDSPGPVFFRQIRMGANSHTFLIAKFRTMVADAERIKPELGHLNKHLAGDSRMFKIHDDPRITRVGKILRRYSLDELPQLWNVLRGDMSLVGPRPLILDEDQHVGAWARRRLELRPGMTGLWQVLGRTDIGFEEMVKLDYLYVTTWSLARDISLLCRTLPVMVRGGGE